MRTVDHEKHQARRTHIIESAVVLFASKGFADTTTADICQAAGISTGSLFHYFPSKQAVFYGIWELDRTEWDEVFAAAEADPDPWGALMAIVDKLAADAAEPIMAGLLVEVIAQAHRDPEFAAGLAENDGRQISDVARLIRRLREAGLADPGPVRRRVRAMGTDPDRQLSWSRVPRARPRHGRGCGRGQGNDRACAARRGR